jgi:6-phosphogluconolactonase
MNHVRKIALASAVAALPTFWVTAQAQSEPTHAVFVMSNDSAANEVIAFERTDYGTLENPQHYATEGRGSGGVVDPLGSQGSLTLSIDGNWLFAVNAGSGTVSVFRVEGTRLFLSDRADTAGSEPNSVTQHGNLVYVLNTAGSSSVVGFRFQGGKLISIPNSIRFLSANAVGSGSVAFSPDGSELLVTEKTTNVIDVFHVLNDGTLSPITVNKNVGPGTFSVGFAPNGVALAAETGVAGASNGSAISSYAVQSNGTLKALSASVPTLGAASCWVAVTDGGRFAYTSNAGTASISGFSIGATGVLTPVPGTVVANNPAGSTNIDIAASSDGRFVYSLNTGTGSIGGFAVDATTGQLTNLGTTSALTPGGASNGIAAN